MTRSREPRWLTRAMVEAIHLANLREHGGRPGLRDEGLLESALARAAQRWEYDAAADVASLAAAYVFGLVKNHAFLDGNKRVGFMAGYVFLGLNGWDLDAAEEEVMVVITGVASGSLGEGELAAWVRERLAAIPPDHEGTGRATRRSE
ncbi:MAG: type II toxin-antitoxin system death-on-curing family toxin [Gemmatimonadaceae bacterium]